MNEGHSAFLALERIRLNVVEKKLNFYSALQVVAAANVFTTHTPVPAGNDSFSREMMQKYFGKIAKELNIPFEELFSFGHTRLNPDEPFSMTILALRLSRHANGVSKLHGEVSRSLWKDVWSGVPMHEVPITSITNGVHTKTWMAPEFAALYRKHLGDWEEHLAEPDFLARGDRHSRRATVGDASTTQTPPHRFCSRPRTTAPRATGRIPGIYSQSQSHP
jgi:starch phosphorylase